MSTRKLFYENPYLKEAEAKVLKIDGEKIFLDKTIFFPFSGGQASDNGTINAQFIKDVQKDGEEIIHFVENPEFKEGDKVTLVLDWERRYKLMRLHSAAHIVYLVLRKKIGEQKMIGSNINPDKARLDYEYPKSIAEFLSDVERETNALLDASLAISCLQEYRTRDISHPLQAEMRKTWEGENGRRWWKLEGSHDFEEKLPCGGLHPNNTKEIGKIVLKRKNLGAGKERVEIILAE